MADNLGYTPGTGAKVATDDLDTLNGAAVSEAQHVQRVKVGYGFDGDFNDVDADSPLPVIDEEAAMLLTRVLNALNAPQGYDRSIQRQRGSVVVESGTVTTVTTVTTVSALTNLANITGNIGTYQATQQVWGANLSAWAETTRARIT